MNKTLYLIAGALLAVGASSCSSDEPGAPDVAQKDETRYIRVNILNPTGSSSRAELDADDFEDGTADENAIKTIYMDFYDKDGNFISRSFPSDMTDATPDDPNTQTPNVEEQFSKIVKVEVDKGREMPSYVMCYINPISYQNAAVNMKDLRTQTRNNYKTSAGNFAMNNSCYYGTDVVSSKTGVKISGTPIPSTLKLFNSVEEAKNSSDASLDIYVERYAAKVKFTLNTSTGSGTGDNITGIHPYEVAASGDNKAYSLTFTPQAWTINAVEDKMYAVKNFSLSANAAQAPTLDEIKNNGALGTWSWNDETRHRSYWACSPGYFSTAFPAVADDIADNYNPSPTPTDGTQYGAGVIVNDDYKQKYYSYNQIYDATNNKAGKYGNAGFAEVNSVKPYMYALETTMGTDAFNSSNPKAAAPAVLVVGKYNVTYNSTAVPDGTTFYLYEGGIYFDSDISGIDNTPLIMNRLLQSQEVLYTKDGDEYKPINTSTGYDFSVKHPDVAARKNRHIPRRYVYLQLNAVPADVYYRDDNNAYKQLQEGDLNTVNEALSRRMSYTEKYDGGKCFYYIPIRHLRWTEDTPAAGKELETNGVINWGNLRSGDMGLVRNHVYTLGVQAIKGLATGIENPDYPILPAADNQYYIKYRINILAWRVVPAQEGIIL